MDMALMATCKRELDDLLGFLREPRRKPYATAQGRHWYLRVLGFWLPTLVLALLVSAGLQVLKTPSGLSNTLEHAPITTAAIFGACLVAPLLEEVIFRWGLRSATYTLFVGPAAVTTVMIRDKFSALVCLLIALTMLVLALVYRQRRRSGALSNMHVSRRFLAHYPKLVWLYITAFALMHVGNYNIASVAGLCLVALFQIPQFLMGSVASYLRLRDGLRSSIMLHFLHNCAAIGIVVLADHYGAN